MSAKYSTDLITAVRSSPVRSLGQDLAYLCVHTNLPAAYVAQVLGVSRMSIHAWFRGKPMRESRKPKVEAFIRLAQRDLENGILPVQSLEQARAYLQEMCDEPIKANTGQARG
jgi:transcriptional regulator with XRE-family HTH domain